MRLNDSAEPCDDKLAERAVHTVVVAQLVEEEEVTTEVGKTLHVAFA